MYQAKKDKRKEDEEAEYLKKQQEEIKQAEERRNRMKAQYVEKLSKFIASYGEPSKKIIFGLDTDFNSQVVVFENSNVVILNGQPIEFKEIVSSKLTDETKIHHGVKTYRTETDNSNMLSRVSVGYLLDGKTGESIGAHTAARNTTVFQEPDTLIHNYIIAVTIDCISNPVIRINLGSHGAEADEIEGLLNIISKRNK